MISTSTHSQHKKGRPDFALLHIQEIQKLGEEKASGTTIRIYMALCAYAMNRCFVSPTTKPLQKYLDSNPKHFSRLYQDLYLLSEHDFIEKSANKKSKYRYFLSFRNTVLSKKKIFLQKEFFPIQIWYQTTPKNNLL